MTFLKSPTARENLDAAIAYAQPHLIPVLTAVRDLGLAMMFVPQGQDPFRIPKTPRKPTMTIVGDDLAKAFGPDAFHMPSIRRVIRESRVFAVVSSAATVEVYGAISATAAAVRVNAVLVETRPEQELAWVALIQKLAPGRPLWLSTIEGGHA